MVIHQPHSLHIGITKDHSTLVAEYVSGINNVFPPMVAAPDQCRDSGGKKSGINN
ncbi:hypothetical protein [Endozoicomonas sp.]|uniref:hypothetical protein n=1 Tax=Endozoicomonas sp. TaxID=1892382 RepID=UPI003AF58FF1